MTLILPLLALTSAASAGVVTGDTGATGALDDVYAPRRVAVVVGVQQYTDPKLQGLRFAEADAQQLGAVLGDDDLGGFDTVWLVTGSDATSRSGIMGAIELASADLQRDDTFLLYLSGHGTLTLDPSEGSRLWFLPSDGHLDEPESTGIAVASLEAWVNELPSRRRVLILDTCHNGRGDSKSAVNGATAKLLSGLKGEPPAPRNVREVSESEARLYAAQYYQPAMEDPALGNGVYTHYLIAALTDQRAAADLDRDGLVDVAEAHDYARDRTIRHTGGMQVPRAEYRIVGREEIYLSGDPERRSTAEQALLSAYDQVLAKAKLLVDGIPRGEMPGLTAIDPGAHTVEIQAEDGETLVRRRVRVQAGATLPLEDLFDTEGSRLQLSAGAVVRHGPIVTRGAILPTTGELELSWLQPISTPHWLRPELHLRGGAWSGPLTSQDGVTGATGDVAFGTSLGLRTGGFSAGPVAELLVPLRSAQTNAGLQLQSSPTLAAGARALWVVPAGPVELGLRYDVRWASVEYAAERTSLWHHGVALGVTAAR